MRLLLSTGLITFFLAACESEIKKVPSQSGTDELTRLMSLAEHVELTVAGDSCVKYYQAALFLAERDDKADFQIDIHINLGNNYLSFEDFEKAKFHFQQSLQISRLHPQFHEKTVDALDWYGLYHGYVKNYDSSLYFSKKSLEYGLKNLPPNHEFISNSYLSIAWHYGDIRKNYELALKYIKKALQIRIGIFGEDSGEVGECYLQMAKWYNIQGDFHRAIEYMEKASRNIENVLSNDSDAVLVTYNYLGEYYLSAGFLEEAKSVYQKIIHTKENKENSRLIAKGELGLALCYINSDQKKAEELFNIAIKKHHNLYSDSSENFIKLYHELGKFYISTSQFIISEEYLKKCESIILRIYGDQSIKYAEINLSFSELYNAQKKWNKSIQTSEKALGAYLSNTVDLIKPEIISAYKYLSIAHSNQSNKIINLKQAFNYISKAIKAIEKLKNNF